MTDKQEWITVPPGEVALEGATGATPERNGVPGHENAPQVPEVGATPTVEPEVAAEGAEARRWHAEAGRKGARRVHELIQEGKLYEQEHGLKRGRQRLRQLLELGKLYEQEHGLRPRKKRGPRLSRLKREELLTKFLQCLLRIARPSFRAELVRLVEALQEEPEGHVA
jgi:hypothetical protein